jgi:hypothetical protein
MTIRPGGTQAVIFKKFAKNPPFTPNFFSPDIDALRNVADSIFLFSEFGRKLFMHVAQNFEPVALSPDLRILPPFNLPQAPAIPSILRPQ